MKFRDVLYKELVRNGYKRSQGGKVWNIANRSFLYMTPELVKAFLNIRRHPRYKKTVVEIEIELIEKHSNEIIGGLFDEDDKCNCNLIDMGCGDGTKAKVFLESLKGKGNFRFCPVSVNKKLLDLALKNVKKAKFHNVKDYKPYLSDLESLEEVISILRNGEYQRNVILLLGSIIAGFDIHNYLFNLSNAMFKGDYILIGNGIRRGERLANIQNYSHPLFANWLVHLMRGLGFKDNEFKYDARFANGRVECFHKIVKDKTIINNRRRFEFKKGDEIITAILYKYYYHELEKFCKMYFLDVKLVKDPESEYALIFCKK